MPACCRSLVTSTLIKGSSAASDPHDDLMAAVSRAAW
jgi:hypothetical protein